jgi:hypothetical protein
MSFRVRRMKTGRGPWVPGPYLHAFQLNQRGEPLDNPYRPGSPDHNLFERGVLDVMSFAPFCLPEGCPLFASTPAKEPQ